MSASSSQGINTLLEAEREAAKIVEKSKQYRVQRLKDARTEATKEIDDIKAQKNAEYQQFISEHAGESGDAGKVHEETEEKLKEIAQQYKENKQKVIAKMMESLVTVKPAPHENSVI
ncbi:hypothetical protein INT44_001137 [Umbelopsis vinacea]|uniref:V-type proton ATPase subunit G n=1 Tax=Umbelopsis vinacea TaxID=44442 RepID=A0A8H7Q8I2_9FUNG|nr:hypothetical protein INT44_001137 [Umbelopsis vinacea]KAI9289260.1 H+-ATPase G subunit-domain-containing protein [Umbelopsis sp. AD052]